ncbi:MULTISPECIES: exosortase F system-associated membrane protein [Tenacibaculum]|uniref:exosortase F system-associated membrane protein n=1 Tax=Tenacibaculum TaxID=104267 RepID=UPI001F0AE260|nr:MULTISPECIES: exosortase F system-associated protein [Tenacibaculum]MCH3881924.1 exosortase F system-associated protein [Tenacibaculum aquimarinum]MDO6598506.1 exosortase F system-associated protein [Tenacibaculum sp. 1_MG-2023]
MKKKYNYLVIAFLFFLLILVRAFSTKMFYDPMTSYFEDEYLHISPESVVYWKLFLNMFYRFLINTVISLGIIWLVFKRVDFVKFSAIFYGVAFIILSLVFYFLLKDNFSSGHLLPFYIRRFIIHPLILLVLLPALYYQIIQEKEL